MSTADDRPAGELATAEQLASLRELLGLASEEEPNEFCSGLLLMVRDMIPPVVPLSAVRAMVTDLRDGALPGGKLYQAARAWLARNEEGRST